MPSVSNTNNNSSRFDTVSSQSSSLLPPNTLTNTRLPMSPTATRNTSMPITTKKSEAPSIAGLPPLVASGGYPITGDFPAPNGADLSVDVHAIPYALNDNNTLKQVQATKNTTPMTGISVGLGGRGSSKGNRANGSGGTTGKRLVEICF